MKRLFAVAVIFTSGSVFGLYFRADSPIAIAGGGAPTCSSKNGDVNADGKIDLTDAVTILGHLFQGNPTQLLPLCETPAPSGLLATGQTKCYGQDGAEIPCDSATCPGQDGFFATGCPSEGRFVDNGDGTVTDNCTGLQWQQNTADVNGDGQTSDNGKDALGCCQALAYCKKLSFAGHDDWRLPNVRELQSIVDYERFQPSIDPVFGALSSFYWSSTSHSVSPDLAWGVYFGFGYVNVDGKGNVVYVRAVRGGL